MKRILNLFLIMLICLTFIPISVKAEDSKYTSMNFEEALTDEEIEHDLSKYKETDDQVTIYLFRGKGCPHCEEFLEFLYSIVGEYGKYFKVESYEVWENQDNSELMSNVSKYLGEEATGVPYIVIGDKTFGGYASSYDDDIKDAIKKLYNSDDRYDVLYEMEHNPKNEVVNQTSNFSIIVFNLVVTALAVVAVALYDKNKRNELISRIEVLENSINKKGKAKNED